LSYGDTGPLRSPQREPIPIDARAADHLRYIRETMESAAELPPFPAGAAWRWSHGAGAAFAASQQSTPRAWLAVWLIEASSPWPLRRLLRPPKHTAPTPRFSPGLAANSFLVLRLLLSLAAF